MNRSLFLPLLASAALLAGCAAQAGGAEAASETEIPVILPAGGEAAALDLSAPDAGAAGVTYADGVFSVESAGVYRVTGSLSGSLRVDADGPVELILAGAEITGADCVRIVSSDPVVITAEAGTENRLADGAAEPDENARAVIYSEAPLTIGGSGAITVTAGANNGVQAKDDLTVTGGFLTVTAANDGLKAKGTLSVTGGTVSVTADGDGLQAESKRVVPGTVAVSGGALTVDSADDAVRADVITVSGGELSLSAGCDGLQADTELTVSGGTLGIVTGGGGGDAISKSGDSFGPMGGWGQTEGESSGAKGLKSSGAITITGGVIDLDTADDAIHCATLCTIAGGDITILSSDDAIHADDMLVIEDGRVNITDCFEGLEAFAVEVRGGDIIIRAVNDGINANGSEMMMRPGASSEAAEAEATSLSGETTTYYRQTGGSVDLVVTGNWNNVGDGIDSNGAVYIDGGVLVVSTFGNTQEGGIDTGFDGPTVTGGMVMAGGASMMQEDWTDESTQCCAVISTDLQPGGTLVTILDEDGNELWAVTMTNTFNCLVLSHPDMHVGHIYTVTYGDGSTTLDFTSTNIITLRGSGGGFGFGGFPGMR